MALRVRGRSALSSYDKRSPTAGWTAIAVALALWGLVARICLPQFAALGISLIAVGISLGVNWAIALYPRTYLGRRWAAASFVAALVLFCDSVGAVGFDLQWRRSFDFTGQWVDYRAPGAGWRARYPKKWTHHEILTPAITTVLFKPSRLTPAIEFTLTRLPRGNQRGLTAAVESYYQNLPKGPKTRILSGGPFAYPEGLEAHRMVHEDPDQALVLRQENVFLLHDDHLYILSVTAVPSWFGRFPKDLQHFLTSLRFS